MEFTPTSRVIDASCATTNTKIPYLVRGSPKEFLIDHGPFTVPLWIDNEDVREDQMEQLGKMMQEYRQRTTEAKGRFQCESGVMATHPFQWTVREEGDLLPVQVIIDHSKSAHNSNPVIRDCPAYFKIRNSLSMEGNEYLIGPGRKRGCRPQRCG